MSGKTNLSVVLESMQISCDDIQYGFATINSNIVPIDESVLGIFKEREGLTVIATKEYLQKNNMQSEGSYAKLTIEVHTSLELVGLTAVLATKLAENQISANVVAAYFHDHVFVQFDSRKKAIEALEALKN